MVVADIGLVDPDHLAAVEFHPQRLDLAVGRTRDIGDGADAVAIDDLDALAGEVRAILFQGPVLIAAGPDAAMIGHAFGGIMGTQCFISGGPVVILALRRLVLPQLILILLLLRLRLGVVLVGLRVGLRIRLGVAVRGLIVQTGGRGMFGLCGIVGRRF